MADPAADAQRAGRAPGVLGALASLACVACCLLPLLVAAGVLGGGAAAVVGWLPALALALAVAAVGTWWLGRRRERKGCSCARSTAGSACGCLDKAAPAAGGRQ
ncbi:mercury transporter [Streptomyces xiangluensis]|uniref:Mercury transporter n=1 Tax=Streptomyces xiangluensis TaxID=2665720 RepID=A0ABV8YYM4_9ACTN